MNKFFLIFGLLVVWFLVGLYGHIDAHEAVHRRVCEYYGGNVTASSVGVFGGVTWCSASSKTAEQRAFVDSINEGVAYETTNFFVVLCGMVFVAFTGLWFKLEDVKHG